MAESVARSRRFLWPCLERGFDAHSATRLARPGGRRGRGRQKGVAEPGPKRRNGRQRRQESEGSRGNILAMIDQRDVSEGTGADRQGSPLVIRLLGPWDVQLH